MRVFLAMVALLPLGSCDVLFNGIFPGALAQATARADFSADIAAAPAGSFQLSIVTAGGDDYVILFSSLSFDSSRTHLVIMDSQLKVLSSYTLGQLAPVAPGGMFSGNVAMTDASDRVVIGNVFFTVLPSGLLAPIGNPTGVSLFGPAITIVPLDNTFHEANYRVSPPLLQWTEYSGGWNAPITYSCTLGGAAQSPRILTVFEDRDSASAPDVFVFQNDSSQQTSFARVPKIDIYNDLTAAVPDFFTYYAGSITTKSNLASESISISLAGVIAYDYGEGALVRFTLDAPDSLSTLSLKWVDHVKVAAGTSGSYCVVWDPATRALTRYEQWW